MDIYIEPGMEWFATIAAALLIALVATQIWISAVRRRDRERLAEQRALAEMVRAASPSAHFHSWEFEPATMTLDPETASLDDLVAAIRDCRFCRATEYPETAEGYDRAADRQDVLEEAARRRFPDIWPERDAALARAAMRQACLAHPQGGPPPAWAMED